MGGHHEGGHCISPVVYAPQATSAGRFELHTDRYAGWCCIHCLRSVGDGTPVHTARRLCKCSACSRRCRVAVGRTGGQVYRLVELETNKVSDEIALLASAKAYLAFRGSSGEKFAEFLREAIVRTVSKHSARMLRC